MLDRQLTYVASLSVIMLAVIYLYLGPGGNECELTLWLMFFQTRPVAFSLMHV